MARFGGASEEDYQRAMREASYGDDYDAQSGYNAWSSRRGRLRTTINGMAPRDYERQLRQNYINTQSGLYDDEQNKVPETPVGPNSPTDVNDAHNRMYNIAQDRYDSSMNDPIDAMILEQLQGRATTDVPYDDKTINQLISQGNESAAASYQSDQRQLNNMAGQAGLNASDPAYIAMQRESRQRQNATNTNTRRDVQSEARVANYDAQGRGVNDLNRANQQQQNRRDNRGDRMIDLYSREEENKEKEKESTQRPAVGHWSSRFTPATPEQRAIIGHSPFPRRN
ncbi:hypothetical protein KAU11_08225 [Candidatus Babeliales bacterium]|nr:hypothetical protein [Candidatus Babeliales bacterium]